MPLTKEQLMEQLEKLILPMMSKQLGPMITDTVAAAIKESQAEATTPEPVASAQQVPSIDESIKGLKEKYPNGILFGKACRAMAVAKQDGGGRARANEALKEWGNEDIVDYLEMSRAKAMAAGAPTAGGFLVPDQFSQDVIEFLRPMSVVRRLNPMILPMPTGTVRVPKITQGSNASYIGENQNAPASNVGTGQVTLTWKKLAVLVPLSNDLVRFSSPGADAIVRDDMVRGMAERENRAFLRGQGVDSGPKGLRYWTPAGNVLAATSGEALADVTTDLGRCILALKEANVPMTRPAWMMAPRTEQFLATIQTTTGAFVFRDEILAGRLWGWPVGVTTEVPTNLSDQGGSAETELTLCDMADAVIGESTRIFVDVSDSAAYVDAAGSVTSAFSQDQTVIRAIAEHDFALRRDVACMVMNGITWGS
jgi:HK97 family phage major capsid protein